MLIHEAVQEAIKTKNYITREEFKTEMSMWIKPTNTAFACLVGFGRTATPRWNPTAEDLTATDWLVVNENDYYQYLRD